MNLRGEYKVTTPPASEPITLAEAKAHLRVDFTDEDTLISAIIAAARDFVEMRCNRALLTQDVTMVLPCWPATLRGNPLGSFKLFRSPLQRLTSISYYDTDGELVEDYYHHEDDTTKFTINTIAEPPTVTPKKDITLPETYDRPDAITIVFRAGWTLGSLVPPAIRQAMLLLIGEMYERRENFVKQLPDAVDMLLAPWTVREF